LENFYQNHRRYVKSRNDEQLGGEAVSISSLNEECEPFDVVNGNAVAPCGAIANSLFNGLIIIISSRNLDVLIDFKDPFFSTRDLKTGVLWH